MFRKSKGFTLIELLVVVSIISLLSSIVLTGLGESRAKARDAFRKSQLRQVQNALEVYKTGNGQYPQTPGGGGYVYWGISASGGSHGTTGSNGYIPNLAPEYIEELPVDPSGSTSGWDGFQYKSDGDHYKLLIVNTPESWPESADPFYDPRRPASSPTSAWMVCSGGDVCNDW